MWSSHVGGDAPAERPLGEVLRQVECALNLAEIPNSRLEAELIVADQLGLGRAGVYVRWNETVPAEAVSRILDWMRRRAAHEPLQYLRGVQEFYSRSFRITPDVLIPRSETECVIDCAKEVLADKPPGVRIVDVGTGSGCLAVTLACLYPAAEVWASDLSEAAVSMGRANSMTHCSRARFVQCDLLAAFRTGSVFDLIVSNPPYLAERDRHLLQPEVAQHEPPLALFGGDDGLDVITRLLPEASARLAPEGWLVMELGCDQATSVKLLAGLAGLEVVRIAKDLAGKDRVLLARLPRPH